MKGARKATTQMMTVDAYVVGLFVASSSWRLPRALGSSEEVGVDLGRKLAWMTSSIRAGG